MKLVPVDPKDFPEFREGRRGREADEIAELDVAPGRQREAWKAQRDRASLAGLGDAGGDEHERHQDQPDSMHDAKVYRRR